MTAIEQEIETREPLMSGFCNFPQTSDPDASHGRCAGGQRANPGRVPQPCPCPHHLSEERFDCSCGGELAIHTWLSESVYGEDTYVHVHPRTGRMTSEYCSPRD